MKHLVTVIWVLLVLGVVVSGCESAHRYDSRLTAVDSLMRQDYPRECYDVYVIVNNSTDRTAALLNAARAASGFTWGEIINRFGGMNANASYTPTTLVYSPTINAGDASGVEKVLQDDKDRLQKWFDEQRMRDRLEVYA